MKYILIIISFLIMSCSDDNNSSSWGNAKFEKKIWQVDVTKRKSMLNNLLSTYDITKYSRNSFEALVGESDTYYLYDEFAAYQLSNTEDCIVFFPTNRETGKIKSSSIHPKGCIDDIE
ncbi:MAG: hypothetical protein GY787_07715 [Alteromonadales bacterium]|nr:hypothetical protein [Alteromonadales bacterium]